MPTLKFRLNAQRQELVEEQQLLLASEELTPENKKRDDEITAQIRGVDEQLKDIERREAESIAKGGGRTIDIDSKVNDILMRHTKPSLPKSPAAKAFLTKIYGKDPETLSMGEWPSSEDFYAAIHRGSGDSRLQLAAAGQMEISDPSGGFSVPEFLSSALLGQAYESSVLVPLVNQVPMRSNSQLIWSFDPSTSASGEYYGGWTPRWVVETASATEDVASLFQLRLQSHKLMLYGKSSNELLQDGVNFQQQLEARAGEAIGASLDNAIINGSGVGELRGMLNDAAIVSQAAEGSQTADTVKYQNLIKMMSRLSAPLFRRDAIWLIHPSTLPELLNLVIGANESFYPVLSESSGRLRMLSLPVLITEHCQALGDQGDIILCSPKEYTLGIRRNISIDRSAHVNFQSDEMTWRFSGRFAGSGTWKSSYTPRIQSGSDTYSWVVTLAARA